MTDTNVYSDVLRTKYSSPSPSDSKQERVKESAGADSKKYGAAGFATMMTQPGAEAVEADVFEAAATATPTAPPVAPPVAVLADPAPPDPAPVPVPAAVKAKRPADASRGTRLPEDWWPDPACSAFAGNAGLNATKEADAFRDYWLARPGAGGRKLDWSATWRNHCREQASRNKARFAPRKQETKPTGWCGAALSRICRPSR